MPAYLNQQDVQPGERIAFLDGIQELEDDDIKYDPTSKDENYDEHDFEKNEHLDGDDNIDSSEADFFLGTKSLFRQAI